MAHAKSLFVCFFLLLIAVFTYYSVCMLHHVVSNAVPYNCVVVDFESFVIWRIILYIHDTSHSHTHICIGMVNWSGSL